MMRKLWWLGGAAAVMAGSIYAVHLRDDSSLRPGTRCCAASQPDQVLPLTPEVPGPDEAGGDEIPIEPTPVGEPPVAAADAGDHPVPPAIVIREDDLPLPATVPEPIDLVLDKGPADVAACPLTMPCCIDDGLAPMPYAEEDEAAGTDAATAEGDKTQAQVHQTAPAAPAGEAGAAHCRQDVHGAEQDAGCPYRGCYSADRHNLLPRSPAERTQPPPEPAGEESEEPRAAADLPMPIKHESRKPCETSDPPPAAPEVDTMEYRGSDGTLDEFGPGPV